MSIKVAEERDFVDEKWDLAQGDSSANHNLAAPLLSELLAVMPDYLPEVEHETLLEVEKYGNEYVVKMDSNKMAECSTNPAEAASRLLLWLERECHVNPEDL